MSKFSRFDLILLVDVLFAVALIVQQAWMRVEGYGDLPSGLWTFCGIVFGGEIITFSLYQMVKEVNNGRVPKTLTAKHSVLKDLEDENGSKDETR